MNQTSLEKIQAASTFLRDFRQCLPAPVQAMVRPYLDQPYQLALNILDCCEEAEGCTSEAIAQRLAISKSSVRQVLSALREGGLVFTVRTAKEWLPLDPGSAGTQPLAIDPAGTRVTLPVGSRH